eukprot:s1789_g4.t1
MQNSVDLFVTAFERQPADQGFVVLKMAQNFENNGPTRSSGGSNEDLWMSGNVVVKNTFIHVDESGDESANVKEYTLRKWSSCPELGNLPRDCAETEAFRGSDNANLTTEAGHPEDHTSSEAERPGKVARLPKLSQIPCQEHGKVVCKYGKKCENQEVCQFCHSCNKGNARQRKERAKRYAEQCSQH